jgi:hypothetical protein
MKTPVETQDPAQFCIVTIFSGGDKKMQIMHKSGLAAAALPFLLAAATAGSAAAAPSAAVSGGVARD